MKMAKKSFRQWLEDDNIFCSLNKTTIVDNVKYTITEIAKPNDSMVYIKVTGDGKINENLVKEISKIAKMKTYKYIDNRFVNNEYQLVFKK